MNPGAMLKMLGIKPEAVQAVIEVVQATAARMERIEAQQQRIIALLEKLESREEAWQTRRK